MNRIKLMEALILKGCIELLGISSIYINRSGIAPIISILGSLGITPYELCTFPLDLEKRHEKYSEPYTILPSADYFIGVIRGPWRWCLRIWHRQSKPMVLNDSNRLYLFASEEFFSNPSDYP